MDYLRGDISSRKLAALCKYVPSDNPLRWHVSEGRPYTLADELLWHNLWLAFQIVVLLAQLGGDKKAKMPKDKPKYPWSVVDDESHIGGLKGQDPLEVLAFLDSL
ncbi:MAG TPA: hypothetical protein GX530_03135 [Corynebacteriales bacterium]|nr:hypothetical protein [Mycobacteriales bacterium]